VIDDDIGDRSAARCANSLKGRDRTLGCESARLLTPDRCQRLLPSTVLHAFVLTRKLTAARSQTVRELSLRYGRRFEQRRVPQVAREELAALGAQLSEFWLAASCPKLSAKLRLDNQRILLMGSDRASVMSLPWELLRDGGEAIGTDAKRGVRPPLPWADRCLDAAAAQLPAGPLRVTAAAPSRGPG
jgi:hypothetical protein